MDSLLNRITSISDTTGTPVTLASYTYLGLNTVIQITYPQPTNHVQLDLWGGTSGVFTGFDNFNRIIDQRWQNNVTTTPADIDRYQYGYDLNSNRVWKTNPPASALSVEIDELYAYDALNRLTSMQRGSLTAGKTAISGTPAQEQDWTLDITGNWKEFQTKAAGSTTLDQTRTANTVNEITTNTYWAATNYDAAGNTTNFPNPASLSSAYTGVYDAWNRLVSVSNGGTTVGQYQYDGANRRIVKTSSPGGTSETRHFYYTANNQDIEERVGTTLDKQFVWGIRYIDELVCRDDATYGRQYATQDANFNVTALVDTSAAVDQRFQYDPYGNANVFDASWNPTSDSYNWSQRFQGGPLDLLTGLYLFRNRDYHTMLGRWLRRDPIIFADSINWYEYTRANPIRFNDPSGEYIFVAGRGEFRGSLFYNSPLDSAMVIYFKPYASAYKCCKKIQFKQWIREIKQGSTGWSSTGGYADDPPGGGFYELPGTVDWVNTLAPGSEANMGDTPGEKKLGDFKYIYQSFMTQAVCTDGIEKDSSYGTLQWYHKLDFTAANFAERWVQGGTAPNPASGARNNPQIGVIFKHVVPTI